MVSIVLALLNRRLAADTAPWLIFPRCSLELVASIVTTAVVWPVLIAAVFA
jgi:hypothetical protein